MRRTLLALSIAACSISPAFAQLSINFGSPGVNIGVNLGGYPTLQRIPGYPVYYAPGVNSNYFFYDGLYWDYDGNDWYESSWYNGPWYRVDPVEVPVYLLRVPVRYYRHAPSFFRSWRADDAPRWDQHWGQSWASRRSGWDHWDRRSSPAPAPLPTYQRQYTGNRYPQQSQQAVIATQNYRYQPQDNVARQHFQQQRTQAQSAPQPQAAPQQQPQRNRQDRQQQPQQGQAQPAQPQQQPQQDPRQVPGRARQDRQQPQQQAQPQPQQAQPQNPAARPQDQRQQRQERAPQQQQPQPQQRQQQQPQPQQQQQQQQQRPQQPQQNERKQEQPRGQGQGEGRGKGNEKGKDNNDQRG